MYSIFFLLLSLFFILYEVVLLPLPFFFLLSLFWVIFISEDQGLLMGFFGGIVFDILLFYSLGKTSLVFLFLLILVILYKRKFQSYNPLFIAGFSFFSTLVIGFTTAGTISFSNALLSFVITYTLTKILFKPTMPYSKHVSFTIQKR